MIEQSRITENREFDEPRAAGSIAEVDRILDCIAQGSDHYGVLGIRRDARIADIRKAYCSAVETLHPLKRREVVDRYGAMHWKMSQAFLRVVEAFSTLSRPARRIEYDASLNRKPTVPLPMPALPEPYQRANELQIGRRLTAAEAASGKSSIGSAYGSAASSIPRAKDRRQSVRYALRLPLRVTSESCDWQEVTETQNVSQTGIRFELARAVKPGTVLHLELPMPPGLRARGQMDKMYVVRAVVRNTSPDGEGVTAVGAEFIYEAVQPSESAAASATASVGDGAADGQLREIPPPVGECSLEGAR